MWDNLIVISLFLHYRFKPTASLTIVHLPPLLKILIISKSKIVIWIILANIEYAMEFTNYKTKVDIEYAMRLTLNKWKLKIRLGWKMCDYMYVNNSL